MSKLIAIVLFAAAVYCGLNATIPAFVFLGVWTGFTIALHFAIMPEDARRFWNTKKENK